MRQNEDAERQTKFELQKGKEDHLSCKKVAVSRTRKLLISIMKRSSSQVSVTCTEV